MTQKKVNAIEVKIVTKVYRSSNSETRALSNGNLTEAGGIGGPDGPVPVGCVCSVIISINSFNISPNVAIKPFTFTLPVVPITTSPNNPFISAPPVLANLNEDNKVSIDILPNRAEAVIPLSPKVEFKLISPKGFIVIVEPRPARP